MIQHLNLIHYNINDWGFFLRGPKMENKVAKVKQIY